jgi:hypothetical protein
MLISGSKEVDDSKKASLEKAQANGFGQPGVAGRKKLSANDVFEEVAKDRLPALVVKSFDALERALSSSNPKIALDAYYKLHKTYYNPDQKVIVEGPDRNEIQVNILNMQDNLNPRELEVMTAFKDLLKDGLKAQEVEEASIIDAEVVEDSSD